MKSNPSVLGCGARSKAAIPPGLIEGVKQIRVLVANWLEDFRSLIATTLRNYRISVEERAKRKLVSTSSSSPVRPKTNATPRATILKPNRAKALTHHCRRHRHSELC